MILVDIVILLVYSGSVVGGGAMGRVKLPVASTTIITIIPRAVLTVRGVKNEVMPRQDVIFRGFQKEVVFNSLQAKRL